MSKEAKNAISHRSRSLAKLLDYLSTNAETISAAIDGATTARDEKK